MEHHLCIWAGRQPPWTSWSRNFSVFCWPLWMLFAEHLYHTRYGSVYLKEVCYITGFHALPSAYGLIMGTHFVIASLSCYWQATSNANNDGLQLQKSLYIAAREELRSANSLPSADSTQLTLSLLQSLLLFWQQEILILFMKNAPRNIQNFLFI